MTSDGERNGPVRIAKGGGENALLKGGEIEAEEPGGWRSREDGPGTGWPWRRPAPRTTTIGSGQVFAD